MGKIWTETCYKNTRMFTKSKSWLGLIHVHAILASMRHHFSWGVLEYNPSLFKRNQLFSESWSWDVTTPDHKIHHAGESSGQCLALWNTVKQKLYLSLFELADHPCSFRLAHTDIPALCITIHQGDLFWNKPATTLPWAFLTVLTYLEHCEHT